MQPTHVLHCLAHRAFEAQPVELATFLVAAREDVAWLDHFALQLIEQGHDRLDGDVRPQRRPPHPSLPVLDAFGQRHFALAREQRHEPGFAKVDLNRVAHAFIALPALAVIGRHRERSIVGSSHLFRRRAFWIRNNLARRRHHPRW